MPKLSSKERKCSLKRERKFKLPPLNASVFAVSFHPLCQSPKAACLQTSEERKETAKLAPEELNPTETLLWLCVSLNNPLGVSYSQNLAFLLSLVSKSFDHTLLHCFLRYEGIPTSSEKQKTKQI